MAVVLKKGVYLVSGKRTPFGKYGGVLRESLPEDLYAVVAKAAFKACQFHPDHVDTVNIGLISPISPGPHATRHAALKAGVPAEKPVLGLNSLSGSAFHAIITSSQEILIGAANTSLAGGMEVLSNQPYMFRGFRFGLPLGAKSEVEDINLAGVYDTYCGLSLIQTTDKVAQMYGISREDADQFSLRSQMRWAAADKNGLFDSEVVPVMGKLDGQAFLLTKDEFPRPDTTIDDLRRLKPINAGGVVTPGNATGMNDGAAAVILASEDALKDYQLTPLSRIAAWCCVGVDPTIMGIGGAVAIETMLRKCGLTLEDIDLFEIHETYAALALACAKHLGVDHDKLNVNGGAIALGHPSGASGARLVTHLTYELRRRSLKRGITSVSVGGGQGLAILIEIV